MNAGGTTVGLAAPPGPALVEWDSEVPAFEVVAAEAGRARAIASEVRP